MQTLNDVVDGLFDYIDVVSGESLSPEQEAAGLTLASDRQKARAVGEVNAALQEIYGDGPSHVCRRPFALAVHAPTTVTLDVTQGATTIANLATSAAWMRGCTIRIDGEAIDNVLVPGADNALTLLIPVQRATATGVTATVYGDALDLPDELVEIFGKPELAGIRALTWAESREQLLRADVNYWRDYGQMNASLQATRRSLGQPHTVWIESYLSPATAVSVSEKWLRLSPLPEVAGVVTGDARWAPQVFTVADLAAEPPKKIQLPDGWQESMLFPIVAQRWTACPWFKNNDVKEEIARSFKVAQGLLQSTKPQSQRGRLRPGMR